MFAHWRIWAAMAGAKGRVNKLAKQPGSGHSSEFFDRVTGLKKAEDEYNYIEVPIFSKAHGRRLVRPLACRSPQSALADEISAIPGYYSTALPEYVAKLPPCFSDHPVVQACLPSPCTPLGFSSMVLATLKGTALLVS